MNAKKPTLPAAHFYSETRFHSDPGLERNDGKKSKKPTLTQLRRETWWWRKASLTSEDSFPPWRYCREEVAWSYELARRANRRLNLPSFPELKMLDRQLLLSLFGPATTKGPWPPFRFALDASRPEEQGWARNEDKLEWNLRRTDNELARSFLKWIRGKRRFQGIKEPRPNKGMRRRPRSWAWPELMDRVHHGLRSLSDSQRSTLSNARRIAKRRLAKLRKAVEERKARLTPADTEYEEFRVLDRFF